MIAQSTPYKKGFTEITMITALCCGCLNYALNNNVIVMSNMIFHQNLSGDYDKLYFLPLWQPPVLDVLMLGGCVIDVLYICQWTGSALVKVMAWCLLGTKPLHEPMLPYCQLDSWEQNSVKFESEFYHFYSRKCIWKCRLLKLWPFCAGKMGWMCIMFSLWIVQYCPWNMLIVFVMIHWKPRVGMMPTLS